MSAFVNVLFKIEINEINEINLEKKMKKRRERADDQIEVDTVRTHYYPNVYIQRKIDRSG